MVEDDDYTRWPEDDAPESHRDGDVDQAYVDPEPCGEDDAPEDNAPETHRAGGVE